MSFSPPEGFSPHTRKSPLTDPWEPLYARVLEDRVLIGLEVRAPHANSRGMLHGGLIAGLVDNAMGLSCGQVLAAQGIAAGGLVTVSLNVDYLGLAKPGQWLVFDTHFLKPGKTLCFAEAGVTADGAAIARARASFKVLPA
ncbi:PaaI family thioesterase [Caulobacter segnis]|uniref:PaaI family thioesterase n=1 Tax=Caulobacter segnis TaxID=88688 RepID=UPI00240FDA28|nr:PaaI family thioesterase [Caulobacter segnis]MDG2521237.1 PaaI family thioesterase [Caulobacter segnis]